MGTHALLKLVADGRGKRQVVTYYLHKNALKPPLPRENQKLYILQLHQRGEIVFDDLTFWNGSTMLSCQRQIEEKLLALGWEKAAPEGFEYAERLLTLT